MLWGSRSLGCCGFSKVGLIFLSSLGGKKAPCFFMVLAEVCGTLYTAPSDLTSSCQETDWRLIFCPCSTATSQAESTASMAGLAESHRGPRLGIPMVCPQGQSWRSDTSGFRVEKSLWFFFFFEQYPHSVLARQSDFMHFLNKEGAIMKLFFSFHFGGILFNGRKKKRFKIPSLLPGLLLGSAAFSPYYFHCLSRDRYPVGTKQLPRKLWFKLYIMQYFLYQSLLGNSLFYSAICISLTFIT